MIYKAPTSIKNQGAKWHTKNLPRT